MSRFFIDRPIVAIVIAILTVVGGLVMMSRLPIAQYPDIVPPIIQIKTTYTGADALTVEKSVATPIEQQVNGVQGMIYMKSINGSDGTMTLQVSFDVGTDVEPRPGVRPEPARAGERRSFRCRSIEFGTTVQQTVGLPLLVIPIYSPDGSYDANFLGNYATININDDLARVPGVGQVLLFGSAQYAMRVWVRPDTLAKLQITVTEVMNAIKAQNVVNPAGQVGARAGATRPGVHLQRHRAGAPHRGRAVRRDHRAREPRRLDRPPLATSRASNSARRPTCRSAASRASRRPWSRSTRRPGSNALATAEALKVADGRARRALPGGPRLRHRARHHAAGRARASARSSRRSSRRWCW